MPRFECNTKCMLALVYLSVNFILLCVYLTILFVIYTVYGLYNNIIRYESSKRNTHS